MTNVYVSPLIRTWETAYLMYPKATNIKVAPYLREFSDKIPGKKPQKSHFLDGASDTPFLFDKNKKRFEEFKNYVTHLKDNKYYEKLNNIEFKNIIIEPYEPYDENNPRYFAQGSIENFIKWYLKNIQDKNSNDEEKILVFCHKNLLKNLLRIIMELLI